MPAASPPPASHSAPPGGRGRVRQRLDPASQKWKSLRVLGLTPENIAGAGIRQAISVYGAFPESGCLGSERFCKFSLVGRPDGQTPATQMQNQGVACPSVLPSGQWWRLLDISCPSGSFVFVREWGS